MNDARLDLRLPQDLLARVKEAAGEGSVNAFVRDALETVLLDDRTRERRLAVAGVPKQPTNADLGARNKPVLPDPRAHRQQRPAVTTDEIPLPKIAPRRWGK